MSGLSDFDSSGDAVLFSAAVTGGVADAGIFRTSARSGQTRAVVKTGDPTPAGGAFSEFLGAPVAVEGGGAVFAAVVDDVYAGIFRTERRGPVELLRIGNAAPGTAGRTVSSFRILTASGRSVLFAAELADGEMRSSSILRGFGDRVVTVAPEGAPVRGGGTLGAFFTDESIPFAHRDGTIVFVADIIGREDADSGLLLVRGRALRPLVLVGDPTELGGHVFSVGDISLTMRGAVYVADLRGGTAASGLFAVPGLAR